MGVFRVAFSVQLYSAAEPGERTPAVGFAFCAVASAKLETTSWLM